MSTDALIVVNNHLRDIGRRALETEGDIECKRALVDEYLAAHPSVLDVVAEVTPVSFDQFQGEWFVADESDPDRRLLYLHGGSWMAGRVEKYRPHISRIAVATGCAVLAIDYRLAPENPFPNAWKIVLRLLNGCVITVLKRTTQHRRHLLSVILPVVTLHWQHCWH